MLTDFRCHFCMASIVVAFGVLQLLLSSTDSIVQDEETAVISGLIFYKYGDATYDLSVPICNRILVAFPSVFFKIALPPRQAWNQYQLANYNEYVIKHNSAHTIDNLVRFARLVPIFLSISSAIFIYTTVSLFSNVRTALMAFFLFVSNPYVIATSHICNEAALSFFLLALIIHLSARYAINKRIPTAVLLSIVAAFSCATSHYFIVAAAVACVIVVLHTSSSRIAFSLLSKSAFAIMFLSLFLVVINVIYGFQGSATLAGDYTLMSSALCRESIGTPGVMISMFEESRLANIPLSLPYYYIKSVDFSFHSTYELPQESCFFGNWESKSHYLLHICVFMFKTPMITLAMIFSGLFLVLRQFLFRLEMHAVVVCSLLFAAAYLVLLFCAPGLVSFNYAHFLLIPFCIAIPIIISSHFSDRFVSSLVVTCCIALLATTILAYPSYYTFHNYLVFACGSNAKLTVDSIADIGQDAIRYRDWTVLTPDKSSGIYQEIIHCSTTPLYSDSVRGIDIPPGLVSDRDLSTIKKPQKYLALRSDETRILTPGWYAISCSLVAGKRHIKRSETESFYEIPRNAFAFFRLFIPNEVIGGTVYVYYLSADDIEAIRLYQSAIRNNLVDSSNSK